MEVQIKKAIKAGNSSAVILPKSWLNRDVRVEIVKKSPETILPEVIEILGSHIPLKEIIGIYLVGSYARREEDEDSDIDILIITKDIDRRIIHEGIYNILIISLELMRQKLAKDLLPIGQMLKEAIPLLNADCISKIKIEVTKSNVAWYLKTTEDKLKLIREIIDWAKNEGKTNVDAAVAYTLVLRIRTMQIIKSLINRRIYSKKELIRMIHSVSKSPDAYKAYLSVKNDSGKKMKISVLEAERLYDCLNSELIDIKRMLSA